MKDCDQIDYKKDFDPKTFQHSHHRCWDRCGKKAGVCDYCGRDGVCCKYGVADKGDGCRPDMGAKYESNKYHHICVVRGFIADEDHIFDGYCRYGPAKLQDWLTVKTPNPNNVLGCHALCVNHEDCTAFAFTTGGGSKSCDLYKGGPYTSGSGYGEGTKCYALEKCDGSDEKYQHNCCGAGGYRCGKNEGDCDKDSDCKPGLRCGTDNCVGKHFADTADCCEYDPNR